MIKEGLNVQNKNENFDLAKITLQQFENVVKKQRKTPETKANTTDVRQPPPSMPPGKYRIK